MKGRDHFKKLFIPESPQSRSCWFHIPTLIRCGRLGENRRQTEYEKECRDKNPRIHHPNTLTQVIPNVITQTFRLKSACAKTKCVSCSGRQQKLESELTREGTRRWVLTHAHYVRQAKEREACAHFFSWRRCCSRGRPRYTVWRLHNDDISRCDLSKSSLHVSKNSHQQDASSKSAEKWCILSLAHQISSSNFF